MDLEALSGITSFSEKSLIITAAICIAAVFVAWYTVRTRIKLSQVVLGMFSYVLVMLLENVLAMVQSSMGVSATGPVYAVYFILSTVISFEVIRYVVIRFVLADRFGDTDSSIGFALGLAGFYLLTCAMYYFNCYSAVSAYISDSTEFFVSTGTDSEEAYDLLLGIANQSGWEFVFTGISRVFFLVRQISLSVLMWYGISRQKHQRLLIVVPVIHAIALIPESLFAADILTSSYVSNILGCVLSAGVAALAAWLYNQNEDQVEHFKVEKLRARRRR